MNRADVIGFLKEARRRRVYVAVVAYLALGAGLIQVIGPITDALALPAVTPRLVTFLVILGFPVVLVLAWIFDVTTEGVRRTGSVEAEAGRRDLVPGSRAGAAASMGPDRPAPLRKLRVRGGARVVDSSPAEPAGDPAPPDPDRVERAARGHVRHELRTPINGILGYAEMVLEEVDDPGMRRDLERIREAGGELLSLIDRILGPDATEGGGSGDGQGIGERIRADLRTPVSAVIGYAEMTMETARERGRDDLVPDLERIRDAAQRLLALSEDIVEMAGAAPRPGEDPGGALGTSSNLAREVLSKIRPLSAAGGRARIEGEGRVLVVDDNPVNRDLLTRGLARAGYMVAEAPDGAEALRLLQDQTFDVVLLDVIMPGMDGVETLRRIRAEERLQDVPVVMLSSLDEVDSVIRCMELGAEEYLVKPVPPAVLEARVGANVELRTMRDLGREYHDRLEADEAFIDRLLRRTVSSRFAAGVRNGGGATEVDLPYATALCCLLETEAWTPGGGTRNFATLEELAEEAGVDMVRWRPGRFLAVAASSGEGGGHVAVVAALALDLAEVLRAGPTDARFRIGLHSGPAFAGLLGEHRLAFEVWGEAVDLAEAVASGAPPRGIIVTPSVHGALRDAGYGFEARGIAEVTGGGQMRLHELVGRVPGDERARSARG